MNIDNDNEAKYLDVKAAAKYLGISLLTFYRVKKKYSLRSYGIGRKYFYKIDELEKIKYAERV